MEQQNQEIPLPASNADADETQDVQVPKRKRVRACDACYKRKIKCDGAVPQCNWCSHQEIPCTFERVIWGRGKRGRGEQQKGSRLADRVSRIEKLLSENMLKEPGYGPSQISSAASATLTAGTAAPTGPSLSPSGSDLEVSVSPLPTYSTQPAVSSSSAALHFAGRELGVTSLITGIPFLLPEGQQWVQARTGQRISLDKISYLRPPWEKQRVSSSDARMLDLQSHAMFELPDRRIVETYFNLFRSTLMQRVFPVVDSVLFPETIKAAYSDSPLGPERADIRACILSFLAFSSILQVAEDKDRSDDLLPLDSEGLAVKAQSLVPQVLRGDLTVEGLEAVVILALFELVTGKLRTANHYGCIAARLLYMLGGHIFPCPPESYSPSPAEQLEYRKKWHLRNLFWVCYSIEKDVALRTGQPQVLSDENCDLTLPPGYVEQLYVSLGIHHHSRELPEAPMFPVDLRLSIIKSRAYSALYSFRALQKTDAELLKEIRELDDELERWRISVPPEWRPTLSFSQETPDPNVSMHSVMLRLNYHLCMTIIHQASSRCKSWIQGQGGMIEGVSSSLALSVEASRSTLLYLQAAEHVLIDGVFWTLIFYPMSALIAIFCNILQNPSDPQATKDLSLLRTAKSIMERVFLRQLSSIDDVVHIKQIADFVTELYRLATCAIEKAGKERAG